MLIAISGSQGAGKTSVLRRLEERGFRTLELHVARTILKDWNLTLEEVNDDHELTIQFQDEITKRKWDGEKAGSAYSGLTFTERTHADVFAYALIDLGRDNKYSNWVDEYYKTSLEYNQYYERVYYLKGGLFKVEHDGVRGSNKHYSRMADNLILDLTKQMIHPSKLEVIETPDLEQRVDIIANQCKLL